MTLKETLTQLKDLGDAKVRAHNLKYGSGENQFGVKMGDIRTLAKKIKTDHHLALELWATGNVDARFLATLIIKPAALSSEEIRTMVKSERFTQVADWFYSYVIKLHPDNELLRQEWMKTDDVMSARAGWNLTSGRVSRNPEGLDLSSLLDRIESEMPGAAPEVQWTMNMTLAQIGINHQEYRERALKIGEKLGIYRDFPVSKGCTSPFAPIWINEIVSRQGQINSPS